jgi:hypothetical protein
VCSILVYAHHGGAVTGAMCMHPALAAGASASAPSRGFRTACSKRPTTYRGRRCGFDADASISTLQVRLCGSLATCGAGCRQGTQHQGHQGLWSMGCTDHSAACKNRLCLAHAPTMLKLIMTSAHMQMLTNIEIRLEEHLAAAEQLPQDVVESAEKAREKERRHAARWVGRTGDWPS